MKINNFIISFLVCCIMIFCVQGIFAQGTIGEYPGAGVGFDSGCGYPDAGVVNPATDDDGLTGNVCGSAFDVATGGMVETTAGFDISGFVLNNFDIDMEAAYGFRVFYGPQDNCCTICLDAMLDLTQNSPCGTFGPQADLLSAFGIPSPANYGLDVFGEEVIPYDNMCPNTEYFVQYQFISATAIDLSDPDGDFCAMDEALITNAGSASLGTIVAPGTRSPLVINSTTLALAGAADCGATDVVLDFTADISAGCFVQGFNNGAGDFCSKGLEFEFRAALACADGTTLDITTGPLINDPTGCYTAAALTGQISLGAATDVCAIFECDPTASLELYAIHTFCEADDIIGDGSGNDEAVMSVSIASILADFDAAMCCMTEPAVCGNTYGFTGPTEVCSGDPIDFLVDPGCDVTLNTIDFGAGTGVFPATIFDLYVYAPGGVPSQVACAGYTVIPADIDGGASGNPDIIYLGSPDNAPGGGPFGIEGCGDLDGLISITNPTCAPLTVTFFVVPYSFDYDSDGDGVYGGYLTDANPEACPVICQDVIIHPILEVLTNTDDGCDQFAGAFVSDGMGGIFDQNGDGALTFQDDACGFDELGPDCMDMSTLDYDYSALDTGMCSGTLTGSLTCVCDTPPSACVSLPEPTPANACDAAAFQVNVDMGGCVTDPSFDVYPTDGTAGVSGWIAFNYVDAAGNFTNCPAGSTADDVLANINPPAGTAGFVFFGESNAANGGGCSPVEIGAFTNPTCDPITIPICLLNGDVNTFVVAFDTDGDGVNDISCDVFETSVTVYPNLTAGVVTDEGATCGTLTAALFDADGNQCAGTEMTAMCTADGDTPTVSFPADASGFDCYAAQDVVGAACMGCDTAVPGCTDPCADNYDPMATMDDGSCNPVDMTCNTDCTAGPFGGAWDPATCACTGETTPVSGCTDATADNYDPAANCDDGSCMTAAVCDISVTISGFACDDGGTPDDPSDDMVTFSYAVVDNGGTGTTWSSDQGDAGAAYGGAPIAVGPVPATNATWTINVNDDGDMTCTDSASINLSSCETVENIPTVGEWGLIILGLMMTITAIVGIRARREEEATA